MTVGQRRVVVVAFEGAQLLDVAGPLQAFATACEVRAETGRASPYALTVASRAGGLVTTSSGLALQTAPLAAAGEGIDTLFVAGGPGVHAACDDPVLRGWLIEQAPRVRRIGSVCTGAFLLAAAGLLEGRRAATHWRSCDLLRTRHPGVRVEPDPIFVRDGPVWTSAGVTAGIDLALALIEADEDRATAMAVARRLVVYLKRPGGQGQFSAPLELQTAARDDTFGALHAWVRENLAGDLRVERLAAQAGMSPRSFARAYAARVGRTPAKAVEQLRLEAARSLLEETGAPVKAIAARCGFGDEERLRRAFLRSLGVTPSAYRTRFAHEHGGP